MGELFGAGPSVQYAARKRLLCERRVAVWDVLRQCDRSGSLDAAIVSETEIANDFETFFRRHAALRAVFFNGRKAEGAFCRHVQRAVGDFVADLALETLPSTSPAYASLSWAEKLRAWRRVREFLECKSSTMK
jgi:hypoxanthine-DNA glycosylase